jgi:putative salt-induced outer membrane protein YdiY
MCRSLYLLVALSAASMMTLCPGPAARADTVTLTSGEVLVGKVVDQSGGIVTLAHPLLGTLTIPAANVQAVAMLPAPPSAAAPPAASMPATAAAAATAPVTASAPAAAPSSTFAATQGGAPPFLTRGFFGNWKCSLDMGANGAAGNSESLSALVAFLADKDMGVYRLHLDSSYRYISSGGTVSTNRATVGVAGDYDFAGSDWFVFGDGRFEYDEFQPWEYRLSVHAGPGYNILRDAVYKWNVRVGAGFFKEFDTPIERLDPEALAGSEFSWQISKLSSVETTAYIYPSMREPETGFRTKETAVYAQKLDFLRGVKWKLGLEHDFDSRNVAPAKKSDVYYYTALSVEF